MTSNVRFYVQPTLKTLLQVVTKEQMANTQQFEKCLNSLQSQPIVNGNKIIIDKSLTLNFTPNGTFTIPLMFNAFSSGMHMPNGPCPDPPDLTGLIRLPTTANCQLYFLTSPNIGISPLYFWLNAIILGICKFKTQVYTLDLNKQTPCKLL